MGSNPILSAIVDFADIEFVAALSCYCGFQRREGNEDCGFIWSVNPEEPASSPLFRRKPVFGKDPAQTKS
jgi:hypothetical protein